MFRVLATLTLAALLAQQPSAQSGDTKPPDASISGRVIDGVSGKPIASADVVMTVLVRDATSIRMGAALPTVTTDVGGAFTIAGLPPGMFAMTVKKEGFLDGTPYQLGQADASASGIVDMAPGEHVTDTVIKLWQRASIAGVVTDDAGDPLVAASIQLLKRNVAGGDGAWSRAPWFTPPTDDRGRYRFPSLPPGDYMVVAPAYVVTAGRRGTSRPTTFYPGVLDLRGATVIHATAGDVLDANFAVTLAAPSRGLTLSGHLVGPDDRVAARTVRLVPEGAPDEMVEYQSTTTQTDDRGGFRYSGVSPGQYRVLVYDFPRAGRGGLVNLSSTSGGAGFVVRRGEPLSPLPDAPTLWADAPVTLDKSNVDDLAVILQPGARFRGRLVFDGSGPTPSGAQLLTSWIDVASAKAMESVLYGRVEEDGTFVTAGFPPGQYGLSWRRTVPGGVPGPGVSGWSVVSMQRGGQERLGVPLDLGTTDISDIVLTLSDVPQPSVSGEVQDARGNATWQARVIVFPHDRERWRDRRLGSFAPPIRQINVDHLGHFSSTLSPGDYLVAAISSVPENWMTPEFLQTLAPTATRVQVGRGETQNITLRVR